MPHNVLERTDHTIFRGWHAGKAEKDAHPARAEVAILTFVLPHAPQEGSKTDQATLGAGRCSLPAKDAHGQGLQGRERLECAGIFSILL